MSATSIPRTAFTIRPAAERGRADFGWLDSRHTFSFGEYYDSLFMGFRSLRVINEDRVAGGKGFSPHPHRDMEIFSYVLAGKLEHKDSLGNGRVLEPGQIQLMSAGTGVTHSEFNPSKDEPTHFLQIWIRPAKTGLKPGYTEWHPRREHADAEKVLVISPDGADDSAIIHQDARIYRIRLPAGGATRHELKNGRGLWLQIMRGEATLNGIALAAGDGICTERDGLVDITSAPGAEALLFDLA